MGVGDQIVDHRHLTVRVGALADIVEMERLGRRVLKARQSSVSDMTSRMTKRLEHSFVVEDGSSGLLRGFLRWWVLSPQGVARILKGEALNGGELCRPSDRTKTRPFGALYIVMILGVDQVAGCRITLEARKLVNEFAKEGLPTFTRPSTWSGLMMVKRPSFRFSRVKQPGSRIFVREAKT